MSAELAMVMSTAVPAMMFFYAAFNIGNQDDKPRHGVLRMFYLAAGQVFLLPTIWMGAQIGRNATGSLMESAAALDWVMYAALIIFLTYIGYVVVMYIRNSTMLVAGEEEFEEF